MYVLLLHITGAPTIPSSRVNNNNALSFAEVIQVSIFVIVYMLYYYYELLEFMLCDEYFHESNDTL